MFSLDNDLKKKPCQTIATAESTVGSKSKDPEDSFTRLHLRSDYNRSHHPRPRRRCETDVICIVHHCPLFCFLLPIYLAHITDDTPDRDVYYATIQNSTLNLSLRNSFFFFTPQENQGKGTGRGEPRHAVLEKLHGQQTGERERESVCGSKRGEQDA